MTPTKSNATEYLMFTAAGQPCAVRSSGVARLLLAPELSRPPCPVESLAGFFVCDGIVFPVLHAASLLGVPIPDTGLYAPIIMLHHAESAPFGLLVEKVLRVVPVDEASIAALPNHQAASGMFTHDERVIAVLAPDRLLLAQERRCIEELRKQEQARLARLEGTVA